MIFSFTVSVCRHGRDGCRHELDPRTGILTAGTARQRKVQLVGCGVFRVQRVGAGAAKPVLVRERAGIVVVAVELRAIKKGAVMFKEWAIGRGQVAVHVARSVDEGAAVDINGLLAALGGLRVIVNDCFNLVLSRGGESGVGMNLCIY